jgi:hypothetical protein
MDLLEVQIKFVHGAPDWRVLLSPQHMGQLLRKWKARINHQEGENMYILHLRATPDAPETRRYVQLDEILSLEPVNA